MDYLNLDSNWLANQIRTTRQEVENWPEQFRELASQPTSHRQCPAGSDSQGNQSQEGSAQ